MSLGIVAGRFLVTGVGAVVGEGVVGIWGMLSCVCGDEGADSCGGVTVVWVDSGEWCGERVWVDLPSRPGGWNRKE